jgi:ASCH domain
MTVIIRAISVRQPYADQILRGWKKVEYRSRPTNIRERVYVYAGLRPGDSEDWDEYGLQPGDLPAGVIIGSVEIRGCRYDPEVDVYEWLLSKPKRIRPHKRPRNQPQPGIWRPRF